MKKIVVIAFFLVAPPIISAQSFSLNWAKQIGDTSTEWGQANAVDPFGNVYTIGTFTGTTDLDPGSQKYMLATKGNEDIFISKLDKFGNFVWGKQLGGMGVESAIALALDSQLNVYITGTLQQTADFDPGVGVQNLTALSYRDVFVCKLDLNGDYSWAKSIGGSGSFQATSVSSLVVDKSGNSFISGSFMDSVDFDPSSKTHKMFSSGNSSYLLRLDNAGNFLWSKQFVNNFTWGNNEGRALAIDNSGNIFVAGIYNGSVNFDHGASVKNLYSYLGSSYIAKFDPSGSFIWVKQFSLASYCYDLEIDKQGSIYLAGVIGAYKADMDPGTDSFFLASKGNYNAFIVKLDASGSFQWASLLASTFNAYCFSIAIDDNQFVYATGFFNDTADFDPGPNTQQFISKGSNAFVVKLGKAGEYIKAYQFENSNGFCTAQSINVGHADNIYITGQFKNKIDFDLTQTVLNMQTPGDKDAFTIKLGFSKFNASIGDNVHSAGFTVFPNPATSTLNITFPNQANYKAEVISIDGKILVSETPSNNRIAIEALPQGLYILKLTPANGSQAFARFVKQ